MVRVPLLDVEASHVALLDVADDGTVETVSMAYEDAVSDTPSGALSSTGTVRLDAGFYNLLLVQTGAPASANLNSSARQVVHTGWHGDIRDIIDG